jgi:hypothetical protein
MSLLKGEVLIFQLILPIFSYVRSPLIFRTTSTLYNSWESTILFATTRTFVPRINACPESWCLVIFNLQRELFLIQALTYLRWERFFLLIKIRNALTGEGSPIFMVAHVPSTLAPCSKSTALRPLHFSSPPCAHNPLHRTFYFDIQRRH